MEKNTLGEIIHHLRKKAGLTQEALADGICQCHLVKILSRQPLAEQGI